MQFTDKLSTTKISRGTNQKKYILVHHTGGGSYKGNCGILSGSTGQVSCHYVVGRAGEIAKIGEHTDILWHAGESSYAGLTNLNQHTIGIEIVDVPNDPERRFTNAQREQTRLLIKDIMSIEKIPYTNIIRHKDTTSRKVDVDDKFWNNQYKTFDEYKNSFNTNFTGVINTIMAFYKDLRTKDFSSIPSDQRIFKDPAGGFDRIKGLPQDQQLEELIYLLAILTQKAK